MLTVLVLWLTCQVAWSWQSRDTMTWREHCSDVCQCTDVDSLVVCSHSWLPRVPPDLPVMTKSLDMDGNQLGALRNSSFLGMTHLEVISVQNNGIQFLETGVFLRLPKLREVRLGGNHLTRLPRNVFRRNRNLLVLDLHGNAFVTLPDAAMFRLHNLLVLNMSSNHVMSSVLGPGFRYTTQLTSLDLSNNNLVSVESHMFDVTRFWNKQHTLHVNLSSCNIRYIHPTALEKLDLVESFSLAGNTNIPPENLLSALNNFNVSSLRSLDLSNMNLSDIVKMFSRVNYRRLVDLNLSYNHITTIVKGTFFYLINLDSLNLNHNRIDGISDMDELAQLRHLNLAYNYIGEIDETTFEGLQELHSLDLSHNALRDITEMPFQTMWYLESLDLSWNQISSMTIRTGLESLRTLHVRSNQITNLGFMERLVGVRTFDASNNIITKLAAGTFTRGHNFALLNLSANAIYDVSPQAFRGSTQDILDFSHNRLVGLDNFGWRKTQVLYLNGNSILNISVNAFKRMTQLETLWLNDNKLSAFHTECFRDLRALKCLDLGMNPIGGYLQSQQVAVILNRYLGQLEVLSLSYVGLGDIPTYMFANMTTLHTLDLSGNSLHHLEASSFSAMKVRLRILQVAHNRFSAPNPRMFTSLGALTSLDLSHNPFVCDCKLLPFRQWMHTTNVSVVNFHSVDSYHCVSPDAWRDTAIANFNIDESACVQHFHKLIIIAVVAGVCIIIITVIVVLVCRYQCKRRKRKKLEKTKYSAMTNTVTVHVDSDKSSKKAWL